MALASYLMGKNEGRGMRTTRLKNIAIVLVTVFQAPLLEARVIIPGEPAQDVPADIGRAPASSVSRPVHVHMNRRTTQVEARKVDIKEEAVDEGSSRNSEQTKQSYEALGRAFAQKYLCPPYRDIHTNYLSWMDGVGAWSYFVRKQGLDVSKISKEEAMASIQKGFWEEYEAVSKTKGQANPLKTNVDALLGETVVLSKKLIATIPAQEPDVYAFLKENIQKPFKEHSKVITSKLKTSIGADTNIGKGPFCQSLKDQKVTTKFTAIAYFERKVLGESKTPWYKSAWSGVKEAVTNGANLVKKAGEKIVEGVKFLGQKIADFARYVASKFPKMEDDREMYNKFGVKNIPRDLRCAVQVSRVLIKSGVPIKGSARVVDVVRQLKSIGWQKVPDSVGSRTEGCVAYSNKSLNGAALSHIGIVGKENGRWGIFDNSGKYGGSLVHTNKRPYPKFYRQADYICPPKPKTEVAAK